ncbi:VTT domain-containing protein [uncultured Fluviicola sp.]|jgi:membrane-associated protein|uniref:DedA family protein n=1 Tax=uncultured Fluviicola sp. TaxID=463303 RepID=UPI0025D94773|nr:VTT domain-containing protein [uncultured Fluviicola sp.]
MIELFKHLFHLDFNWVFDHYRDSIYVVLFVVIFIETGLIIMPFLPGDSLLFMAGMFAANGKLDLAFILGSLAFAAILGDNVNYWIGRKLGLGVFEWKIRGRQLVKQSYLTKTEQFFEKRGVAAIIMARFVPIVRTFTPFAAGIGKMKYRTFLIYDIIGGILWITSMTLAGYFLGEIEWVRENNEKVVLLIILVSVLPMLISFLKSKFSKKDA